MLLHSLNDCLPGDVLSAQQEEHFVLPRRRFNDSNNVPFCLRSLPLLLEAEAASTLIPGDLATYEGAVEASVGWREYTDHHRAGWIVNKHADEAKRVLSFPLRAETALPLAVLLEVVKISYLATYRGAYFTSLYFTSFALLYFISYMCRCRSRGRASLWSLARGNRLSLARLHHPIRVDTSVLLGATR